MAIALNLLSIPFMKRKLLLAGLFSASLVGLQAAPIDSIRAIDIARNFYVSKIPAIRKAPAREAFDRVRLATNPNTTDPRLYIYNIGQNDGFVIVSGDDNAIPVLGYATSGSFNMSQMPPAVEWWLNEYSAYVDYLSEHPATTTTAEAQLFAVSANPVEPLLGEIQWNQMQPYNMFIPSNLPTGCVATAGAQIMKYHAWPVTGSGSANGIDFSTGNYEWDLMLPRYTNNPQAPLENREAVAKLMQHVGASVNMKYAAAGSAATDYDMAKALRDNFGYDTNIQEFKRDYYSLDTWKSMLLEEITNARPVIYSGHSTVDGHTFVCDGYDGADKFHFNWGWGGSCDGYFAVTQLVPSGDLGIGSGQGSFNLNQRMIGGIQKPNANSVARYEISIDQVVTPNKTSGTRSDQFSVNIPRITNWGIITYDGSMGLALYKDGEEVAIVGSKEWKSVAQTIQSNNSLDINFATTIPDGTYELYPFYVINGQRVRMLKTQDNIVHITAILNGNQVTLEDNAPKAQMVMSSMLDHTELQPGKPAEFYVTMRNDGNKDYKATIGVFLFGMNGTPNGWFSYQFNSVIPAGEERTVTLKANAPTTEGQYKASVRYDPTNTGAANLYGIEPVALSEKVVTVSNATSLLNVAQKEVRLFVDDAAQQVILQGSGTLQEASVFTLSGICVLKQLSQTPASELSLPISSLSAGTYLVQVKDANGMAHSLKFYKK